MFFCVYLRPLRGRKEGGGAPIRRWLVCNETTRGYYFVCLLRRQELKKSIPLSTKFFRPPAVTTSGSYFNKTTYYFVWLLFHPYGVLSIVHICNRGLHPCLYSYVPTGLLFPLSHWGLYHYQYSYSPTCNCRISTLNTCLLGRHFVKQNKTSMS